MYASLIALICASFPLTANLNQPACQKATEAYFAYTGFNTQFKAAEGYATRVSTQYATRYVGREIMATGAVIYTATIKRSVSFSTHIVPLVGNTSFECHVGGAAVKLGWNF
jgi:hypothetical protein